MLSKPLKIKVFKHFDSLIRLGFQYHPIWIKLEVLPQPEINSLLVTISPPVLDEIRLIKPDGKGWNTKISGDIYPKNIREVKSNNSIFFINQSNKEFHTISLYLKKLLNSYYINIDDLNEQFCTPF